MWLACYTEEEIAEKVGISQPQAKEILSESANLPESIKPAASHLTDFEVPISSVWNEGAETRRPE
jgi:hypothetical protein